VNNNPEHTYDRGKVTLTNKLNSGSKYVTHPVGLTKENHTAG
jgi:hypothetical protein